MIITFTNVIGAIRNAISSVITTNLKMWLGFETSETLGREEVVNGDFSDGTTGWAKSTASSATISVNANDQLVLASDAGDTLGAYSSISLIEGQTYTLSIDYISSNQLGRIEIGTSTSIGSTSPDDIFNAGGSGVELGTNTYTFTASATQSSRNYLYIGGRDDVNSLVIDNVSLKELTQITPDKSGNNNVGELFTGKAIEFDGLNDNVDIDFTTPIKSAVFWVKPLDTGVQSILGFGGSFSGSKYIKSINNNIQSAGLSTVSVYVNGVSTTSVPLDQWSRVVVNFALLTPQELKFGFGFNSYGHIQLSDVQLYNENLSTDDIAFDYANPNKLAIDNPSTSLSVTNLKGYWALSEGDGLVAYDSGTNLEEEEVVNGDGSSTVDWDSLFSNTTLSINNDKLRATSNNSSAYGLSQELNLNNGSTYQVVATINVDNASGGTGNLRIATNSTLNSGDTTLYASTGTITTSFVASANTMYIGIVDTADAAGNYVEIDSISVREVTPSDHGGLINGATYVDAQPRIPQLGMMNWSKGSNLLTYSEDFSQWTQEGSILTTDNSIISPDGNQNASKLQLTGSSSNTDGKISFNITSNATTHTFSVFGKKGNHDYIYIWMNISGGTNITRWIDLDDGSINVGTGIATVTTTSFSNDWWKIEYIFDATNLSKIVLEVADDGVSTGTGGDNIYIWGAQLEESSSAGAYRLTDGAATLNSTVIANPTIPTQDIFGNAVRDRLNSFNLGEFGGARVDDITLSGNQVTFQLWFKNVNSNDSLYLADIHSATDRIVLGFNSSQLSAYHELTGSWQNFGVITDGDWNFATFTFDGTTLKCFVGTSQLGVTKTITAINIGTTEQFGIGMNHYFPTRTQDYNGHISDFLIYDRVLTSDEIENNYNAGLSAHTN